MLMPSRDMLELLVRRPLITVVELPLEATPALVCMMESTSRSRIGRFLICSMLTVVETSAVATSTPATSAETSTLWVTPASSSLIRGISVSRAISTVIPRRVDLRNPLAETARTDFAGRTPMKFYKPSGDSPGHTLARARGRGRLEKPLGGAGEIVSRRTPADEVIQAFGGRPAEYDLAVSAKGFL